MRLECVASWTLMSPVQSMAKVRLAHSRRDALLLAFMDAKVRSSTVIFIRVANDHRPGRLINSKNRVELKILVVVLCHYHAVVVD